MSKREERAVSAAAEAVTAPATLPIRPAVEPTNEPLEVAPVGSARTVAREASELIAGLPCRPVPRARRVFVNRTLRMDVVEAVGFDMDYTLAVYHHRRIESLAYRMTAEALIRSKGYPEELRGLSYQPNSVIRGLVVDKVLGNVFKMDRHYHVARVHHGRRPLSKDERVRLYRMQKIRPGSGRYVWVDTLFALPEVALFADLVELFDERAKEDGVDYASIYDDVRNAIDGVHRDGSLKKVIKEDIAHYIRHDPELGPTLHRLRSSGKRLFLLTNSYWEYTNSVMSFLLDCVLPEYPSWRGYFDLVMVGAGKPTFFGERQPFRAVDPLTGATYEHQGGFARGGVYEGGNLKALENATGWEGDKVLYVGDHIYGDILRTKRSGMWRTAMIVHEIEEEVAYLESRCSEFGLLRELEGLRLKIDDEIAGQKATISDLERRIEGRSTERVVVGACPTPLPPLAELVARRQEARVNLDGLKRTLRNLHAGVQGLGDDLHRGMNPNWGMLFREGHENSRFAEQVEAYACLYTGRVSNLLAYSPERYFRSRPSPMAHEIDDPAD